jgi:ParB-like chromosome segregation protein Spo0J
MDKVGPLPQVSSDLGLPLEEETNQGHTIIMSGTGGADLMEEIIKDFPEGQQDLEADRATLQDSGREETGRQVSIVGQEVTDLATGPGITAHCAGNMITKL